ncbi:MAG: FliM/FliN family flagellar motor switch protein [bacterium]|nr:FliM/FliN family flagellar motor switch protein [bacterium]
MAEKKPTLPTDSPKPVEQAPTTDKAVVTDESKPVKTDDPASDKSDDNDNDVTQIAPPPVADKKISPPAAAKPAAAAVPKPAPVAKTAAANKSSTTEEINANDLLENITTPLVVELGRVSLTIVGIGDLKAGTIIELSKTPSDAVDLVVGGKCIGKGELVEVEGDLGVRIVSLVQ